MFEELLGQGKRSRKLIRDAGTRYYASNLTVKYKINETRIESKKGEKGIKDKKLVSVF